MLAHPLPSHLSHLFLDSPHRLHPLRLVRRAPGRSFWLLLLRISQYVEASGSKLPRLQKWP